MVELQDAPKSSTESASEARSALMADVNATRAGRDDSGVKPDLKLACGFGDRNDARSNPLPVLDQNDLSPQQRATAATAAEMQQIAAEGALKKYGVQTDSDLSRVPKKELEKMNNYLDRGHGLDFAVKLDVPPQTGVRCPFSSREVIYPPAPTAGSYKIENGKLHIRATDQSYVPFESVVNRLYNPRASG